MRSLILSHIARLLGKRIQIDGVWRGKPSTDPVEDF